MPTLGEEIAIVQEEMGRGSDAQVRRAILAAIAEHEREMHHWTERRLAIIELQTGQTWYSQIGFRNPSLYTTAQIESIQAVNEQDIEWSFDDMPWTGRVADVIRVQYARLEDGDANGYEQSWRMRWVPYEEFEIHHEGPDTQSQPYIYTLHSHQIGVYPPPDKQYPLRLSVLCKPFAPTEDGQTSVFFTEAEELIRNAAKKRLAVNFRDGNGYALFKAEEADALSRLRGENARRSSGKIKGHGPT